MAKMRVGCDLVFVTRFKSSVQNEAFLRKVFHPEEIADCNAKASREASYAARFAAKEAFAKALGVGLFGEGIGLTDVWIRCDARGKPHLQLAPHAQAFLSQEGFEACDVSLSHHGEYALATVLLY